MSVETEINSQNTEKCMKTHLFSSNYRFEGVRDVWDASRAEIRIAWNREVLSIFERSEVVAVACGASGDGN